MERHLVQEEAAFRDETVELGFGTGTERLAK
jgi:hypothetical protein